MNAIIDTGPLVAVLRKDDRYHDWARKTLDTVSGPFVTCEAVLSEACFLLRGVPDGPRRLLELVERTITVAFRFSENEQEVRDLMVKYASVPMAFADACLVRMAEIDGSALVVTLDTDFRIYRRKGRKPIQSILPADR